MFPLLFFFFLSHFPLSLVAAPAQRTKCSLECYDKCMQSGTPNSVYCNCPVESSFRTCNSVNDKLMRAEVAPDVHNVHTEFVDAHTVRLHLPDHPGGFVYIFEYSVASGTLDDWMFAGSSPTASLTFTIGDPCRDYQFRVLIIIRTTNPSDPFVIYRPKPIDSKLPPFAIDPKQITVDDPVANILHDTLKVNVKWTNPIGFDDSDIYGYESPSIYPIQCKTPEGELPIPRTEIVSGGGQMAVNLPSSILEARCRLWVEVRILPRCARLTPFLIQKSLELDCEKNPNIEVCKKDAIPSCTDIIDVWGSHGKATVMWQSPDHRTPLYYHVRYGPAQMQGVAPFVSWQIMNKKDVKVQGNVKSFSIEMPEDVDFGVQVCAIYSSQRQRAKLGVAHVTPFMCSSCKNVPSHSVGRCGECAKIESGDVGRAKNTETRNSVHRDERQRNRGMVGGIDYTGGGVPQTQTVLRMEADLVVNEKPLLEEKKESGGESVERREGAEKQTEKQGGAQAAQAKSLKTTNPIEKDGLVVNEREESEIVQDFEPNQSIILPPAPPLPPATNNGIEEGNAQMTETSTVESTTDGTTTSIKEKLEWETQVEVLNGRENSREGPPFAVHPVFTQGIRVKSQKSSEIAPEDLITAPVKTTSTQMRTETTTETTTVTPSTTVTVEQRVKEIATTPTTSLSTDNSTTPLPKEQNFDLKLVKGNESLFDKSEDENEKLSSRPQPQMARKIENYNLEHIHRDQEKCTLSNGVVCENGCENSKKCRCSLSTHHILPSGECIVNESKQQHSTTCLPKKDVNATWDPDSGTLLVKSLEVRDHLFTGGNVDKIYIEFGKIKEEKVLLKSNVTIAGFVFAEEEKQRKRVIMSAQRVLHSHLFESDPFVFQVNGTVDIMKHIYGLRICTFNSSDITNAYEHNWDKYGFISDQGSTVQVVQVSPIHFTKEMINGNELIIRATTDTYWHVFFTVGKISVLVVLLLIMCVLIYLNCTKLKLLYDRKRTHYFRPYFVDQMHLNTISRQYANNTNSSSSRTFSNHPNQGTGGAQLYAKRRNLI